MTDIEKKRQEIEQVILAWRDDTCLYPEKECEHRSKGWCTSEEEAMECLKKRLDELGVVIKVDKELPDYDSYYKTTHIPKYDFARRASWSKGQLQMLKAGFAGYESLIPPKEVSDGI